MWEKATRTALAQASLTARQFLHLSITVLVAMVASGYKIKRKTNKKSGELASSS